MTTRVNHLHELLKLVDDDDASVAPALESPVLIRATRQEIPQVKSFLIRKLGEIFKLALSEEKSLASGRALAVLCMPDADIIKGFLKQDLLQTNAKEVLSLKDVTSVTLGRISSIALAAVVMAPNEAKESCGFVHQFLQYCSHPAVFNFLDTICSEDPKNVPIQEWLIKFEFHNNLQKEFENFDYDHSSELEYKDERLNYLNNLYTILGKCLVSKTLGEYFRKKEFVDLLLKEFPSCPLYILNTKWQTIFYFCCQDLANDLLPYVPIAMSFLDKPFDDITSYRMSALDFISEMMKYDSNISSSIVNSPILQVLTDLFDKYPYCTMLHTSFSKFIQSGSAYDEFSEKAVPLISPLLIVWGKGRKNRVRAPSALRLLEIFLELEKKDERWKQLLLGFEGMQQFIDEDYSEYKKVIDAPYGGDTQRNVITRFKNII